MISVIIPAYNEEKLLPAALEAIQHSLTEIADSEIIVVDNESTDRTREIAAEAGAKIVTESVHNIGAVRNAGASVAKGNILVFIDADTVVRPPHFAQIESVMSDAKCAGGSVRVEYEGPYTRFWMSFFMRLWVVLGKLTKMRQGALQFCRVDLFRELGGYDETIYVGEDIDFHWRLDRAAKRHDQYTSYIETPMVVTSARRWNRMGLVRMLFFTHPITIFLAWRLPSFWKDWYERAIR